MPINSKKKSKKPSKNKKLKIKFDAIWSEKVKARAGYKCEICGKTTGLNSHHIISRSNLNLRWDLHNGICLCVSCHSLSNNSAHKDPMGFMFWIREHRKEDFDYLLDNKNEIFDKDYERVERGLNE